MEASRIDRLRAIVEEEARNALARGEASSWAAFYQLGREMTSPQIWGKVGFAGSPRSDDRTRV